MNNKVAEYYYERVDKWKYSSQLGEKEGLLKNIYVPTKRTHSQKNS